MFLIEAAVVEEQSVPLSGSKPTDNHTIITVGIPAVFAPPVHPTLANASCHVASALLQFKQSSAEQPENLGALQEKSLGKEERDV